MQWAGGGGGGGIMKFFFFLGFLWVFFKYPKISKNGKSVIFSCACITEQGGGLN